MTNHQRKCMSLLCEKKFYIWTPDLLEVNGQNIITKRVIQQIASNSVKVYEYSSRNILGILNTILLAFELFFEAQLQKRSVLYIVCSRSVLGFIRDVIPLLASRFGVRVIVHVHGSDLADLLNNRIVGFAARWLYAGCEVIVPSSHLINSLAVFEFKKLILCENFSEPPNSQIRISEKDRQNKILTVLWNSNIISSKGITELVDAIKIIRKEGHLVELKILGKPIGDCERSVQAMRNFLDGLEKYHWISVCGQIQPSEVPRLVAECDVIALPSTYQSECQPLAVIQGMLFGRRIIVADTPALRATVGEYPAFVVNRNPIEIAEALKLLLNNCENMIDDGVVARAQDRFSPVRFDKLIRKIFMS